MDTDLAIILGHWSSQEDRDDHTISLLNVICDSLQNPGTRAEKSGFPVSVRSSRLTHALTADNHRRSQDYSHLPASPQAGPQNPPLEAEVFPV